MPINSPLSDPRRGQQIEGLVERFEGICNVLPADLRRSMREVIRSQLHEAWFAAYMAAKYGDWVDTSPEAIDRASAYMDRYRDKDADEALGSHDPY